MDVRAGSGRGAVRLILGAALLALTLAGCASHRSLPAGGHSTVAEPQHTVTDTFRPYAADGELAITVHDVASGSCWTTSIAAPARNAYRCFGGGNTILDPCFAAPKKSEPPQVACVASPWSEAQVLTLTEPLPAAPAGDAPVRPWAFQLATGVRCVASTGTVPAVRGVNLAYHCTDGHDAALVNATAATVTANYGDVATQTLQRVTVTTTWRG
jgi:hypothetical protein